MIRALNRVDGSCGIVPVSDQGLPALSERNTDHGEGCAAYYPVMCGVMVYDLKECS